MDTRSEKEKMLAGERYNLLDPELDQIRLETKRKLRIYNASTEEDDRWSLLGDFLGQIGENVTIWTPFYCTYGEKAFVKPAACY